MKILLRTMKTLPLAFLIVLAFAAQCAELPVQEKKQAERQKTSVVPGDPLTRAVIVGKVERGAVSVGREPKKKKQVRTEDILASLKDDDVLVDVEGDKLKWGLLRKHVAALCSGIDRPDMMAAGNAAVKEIAFQTRCRKLLKEYLEYAVFAVEAKRIGLAVDPKEFETYRAMAHEAYGRMGTVGEALIKLIDSGESFYEHNLTNALYWKAYRTAVLEKDVKIDDEKVQEFVKFRHGRNLAALETNAVKRVLIEDIQKKLKKGMDIGEAARKWSDCDSAETNGILMDDHGEVNVKFSKDMLPDEVAAACVGLKEGEISGVIETPEAWHVVKLLKRNPPKDEEEETVELAQVKLEKELIVPEYSSEEAYDRLKKTMLKEMTRKKFLELFNKTKIDCRIPLKDPKSAKGPRIKRIR